MLGFFIETLIFFLKNVFFCNFASTKNLTSKKLTMITYSFNKKTKIVEYLIEGENTIKEFTDYLFALSKEKDFPEVLKIFSNGEKGCFAKNINPEDMYKIAEAIKELLKKHKRVYTAFIISTAMETALAELYKDFSKAKNYYFEVFYTKEAAINWLNSF